MNGASPIVPQLEEPEQPPKLTPQQLGGRAVLAKYGRGHFSDLGREGYRVTCDRWFGGDRDLMNHWLARKGLATTDAQYEHWGFHYFKDPGPHPAHVNGGNKND